MKKGITAASVSIMVAVIIILATTVTITAYNSVQNAKKLVFALEISQIQEEVTRYYNNSSESLYPITEESYTINLDDVTESDISQFEAENKTNNNKITVYKLNLETIDMEDTTYGNLDTTKDVYVVSKDTGIVYYLEGVKSGNKTYYAITQDLIDIKERNEKEDEEEASSSLPVISSDGIVERELTDGTKEKYIANVEVTGSNIEIVKYEIGIIKEKNAKSYFQNGGKTLIGDRIKLKKEVPITIYAENSKGDFVIKYAGYPYIPEEFIASDKPTEDEVNEGLVIYEGNQKVSEDLDAETTRNQFVWVPVTGELKQIDWENNIFRCEEPITAELDNVLNVLHYADEIEQYYSMKASVEKYGGFYVARYEAGLPEGKTYATAAINGMDKPVSKKNATVWNVIAWDSTQIYNWDTNTLESGLFYGDDSQDGLAKVAKFAINTTNSDVVSHLIYGAQWDAVMKFMQDIENPNVPGKKYIEDSTGMGAYNGGSLPSLTGFNENYKVKNIYDMAGNVMEKTYEINTGYSWGVRVSRGGDYINGTFDDGPDKFSAFYRSTTGGIDKGAINVGFRVVLYIK